MANNLKSFMLDNEALKMKISVIQTLKHPSKSAPCDTNIDVTCKLVSALI